MSSSASEDSDAPETLTLSASRNAARTRAGALREAEAAAKAKQKAKNRQKDHRLKEQAENAGKSKWKKPSSVTREDNEDFTGQGENEDQRRLEQRMQQAMEDADDEEDEEMASWQGEEDEEEFTGVSFDGASNALRPALASGSGSEDEHEEVEETETAVLTKQRELNYLPDHIFKSAFTASSESSKPSKLKLSSSRSAKKQARRKRRPGNAAKDIAIGSRIIRTLPSSTNLHLPSKNVVLPSSKARRFVDRSLANKSRTRGWERKPANIGVLKGTGPAAHFVRS